MLLTVMRYVSDTNVDVSVTATVQSVIDVVWCVILFYSNYHVLLNRPTRQTPDSHGSDEIPRVQDGRWKFCLQSWTRS